MNSVFKELESGLDIVSPHRESHILWMGPGTSTDVTRKRNLFRCQKSTQPSGALIVTLLVELFKFTKYVFVTEFSVSLSLSDKEDERSRLKFHKNEFPPTPP